VRNLFLTVVAPEPANPSEPGGSGGAELPGYVAADDRAHATQAGQDHLFPQVAATPAPPRTGGHLPFFPGLEGLRGVAVAAVLLFHAGFAWMPGGFLGVSTFFTLSGFLITALLLAERGATARVDIRSFWRRRFRRLMPAALAALGLAVVFGVFAADAVQKRNLAGDVVACLLYVANWRFLFSNQSYADLFGKPSPVLQFWSLAIEEQFYFVFPLFSWLLLQRLRLTRARYGVALVALLAGSIACLMFLGLSHDAIYYGTETRAAEILVGALLAVAMYHHKVTKIIAEDERVRAGISIIGIAALVACVAAWVLVDQSDDGLYHGGLIAYACLSAAVILAAITPHGPLRIVLGVRPLRWVGRISYGVYLYHWPVFLWISEERTGWTPLELLAPRLLVTFGLALLSYRYLEVPVRRGQRLFKVPAARLAPVAVAAIVVSVLAVTITAPKPIIDFDAAAAQLQSLTASQPAPAAPIDPTRHEAPFPRMAVFGDSTALMTALGLTAWSAQTKAADVVDGAAWLGCGIGRGGLRRDESGTGPVPDPCNHWERTWGQKVKDNQPNIAVVQIGPWEVADRKLEGDDTWRAPGDPVYDAFLLNEMTLAVDTLSAEGADVLWLTSPLIGPGKDGNGITSRGVAATPARMNRVNQLIESLPSQRPGKVHVVDLAGWLASTGDDVRLRPDGEHFGQDESKEVATRWLGQTLVDTFKQDWSDRAAIGGPTGTGVPGTTPPGTDGSGAAVVSAPGGTDTTTSVIGSQPGTTLPVTLPQPSSTTYTGPKRKVLVVGDESAQPIADGLKAWGDKSGDLDVASVVQPGCGALESTERSNKGTHEPTPPECQNLTFAWLQATVAVKPDIVVIVPSVWDLTDLKLKGDDTYRSFGDSTFEDELWNQFTALATAIHKGGAEVAWLNSPPVTWGRDDQPPPSQPVAANDPARVARYNDLIERLAVASGQGRTVDRVDFAKYAGNWPTSNPPLLPNGLTVGADAAPIVGEWLGNELLVYYDEYLSSGAK
jgi:peptidoglycan/LPS O-acetylase OafA/YrhL